MQRLNRSGSLAHSLGSLCRWSLKNTAVSWIAFFFFPLSSYLPCWLSFNSQDDCRVGRLVLWDLQLQIQKDHVDDTSFSNFNIIKIKPYYCFLIRSKIWILFTTSSTFLHYQLYSDDDHHKDSRLLSPRGSSFIGIQSESKTKAFPPYHERFTAKSHCRSTHALWPCLYTSHTEPKSRIHLTLLLTSYLQLDRLLDHW